VHRRISPDRRSPHRRTCKFAVKYVLRSMAGPGKAQKLIQRRSWQESVTVDSASFLRETVSLALQHSSTVTGLANLSLTEPEP
jgi:hypothetical protein